MVTRKERQPEAGITASCTPCILAIDDVNLKAPLAIAERIASFYIELLGLDPLPAESTDDRLAFYGYPRSGPRLYVNLVDESPIPLQKRQLLLQIASLFDSERKLIDSGIPYEWSHGWSYYDRRLAIQDPADNRIELVAYHLAL